MDTLLPLHPHALEPPRETWHVRSVQNLCSAASLEHPLSSLSCLQKVVFEESLSKSLSEGLFWGASISFGRLWSRTAVRFARTIFRLEDRGLLGMLWDRVFHTENSWNLMGGHKFGTDLTTFWWPSNAILIVSHFWKVVQKQRHWDIVWMKTPAQLPTWTQLWIF